VIQSCSPAAVAAAAAAAAAVPAVLSVESPGRHVAAAVAGDRAATWPPRAHTMIARHTRRHVGATSPDACKLAAGVQTSELIRSLTHAQATGDRDPEQKGPCRNSQDRRRLMRARRGGVALCTPNCSFLPAAHCQGRNSAGERIGRTMEGSPRGQARTAFSSLKPANEFLCVDDRCLPVVSGSTDATSCHGDQITGFH
jgi:hypothetical protein